MQIKIVSSEKDLLKFIKFPWKVYKNDSHWVPQLVSDTKLLLNEKKNFFWEHAERKLFYVENSKGEILGRVAGVIDYNFIRFHKEETGFFAFFESVNDYEIAELLLSAVESWLKEKKIKKILGPTAPSTNDEMGLLYEGYNSDPFLMMPYNPPYYHSLIEKYGFKKAKDLFAYIITKETLSVDVISRIKKIVDTVKNKYPQLVVRPVNIKNFDKEIKYAVEIYNAAWEKNWGFVPWTEKEFVSQAVRLKPLIKKELVLFAFLDSNPVGIIIGVPNYNEVLKKLNGKLGPVEIIKFLYFKNKIKSLRIMIMGVKKEYRNRGIEGVLYFETIMNGLRLGYERAEFSWILEDNIMMTRAAEMLGGKLYKKYRVYEKMI